MPTHYEILGVAPSASLADIRKAYITLSRRYHPDKLHSSTHVNEETFKHMQAAYEVLSDASKRAEYDNDNFYDSLMTSVYEGVTSFLGLFQACARMHHNEAVSEQETPR